jgi:diguanylate cyclase (GGDEF)-like protein
MNEVKMTVRTSDVTHRMLRLMWPFAVVALVQALLTGWSLDIMSTVRAYVAGEGLWTSGQKDAIYFLDEYAAAGDDGYFDQFQRSIAVPLADRAGRRALERSPPDLETARKSWLAAGNHPKDIDGLIWLFLDFRWFSHLRAAVDCWVATDPLLDELFGLGNRIHDSVAAGPRTPERVKSDKAEIEDLNRRLTPLAIAFSQSLGTGSRAIAVLLTAVNLMIAAALISLAAWHTRRLLLQRQSFEHALTAERKRASITLASLGEAVISTNALGGLVYMNPAAERLTGVDGRLARNAPLSSIFHLVDTQTQAETELIAGTLAGNATMVPRPHRLIRSDGLAIAVSVTGAQLQLAGASAGAVFVLHDKTREEAYISKLAWQASHDELTGLLNRREFERRLEGALAALGQRPDCHSLMFLDLDQFKIVNDTCGHAAGDKLLRQVTRELQVELPGEGVLARIGGDEFAVLAESCDPQTAASLAEKLRRAVERLSFDWNGRSFRISVSIGLVHLGDPNVALEEALRTADVACYTAKEKGRNRIQIHRPTDSDLLARVGEMAWVHRIRQGLDEGRFCLYAQEIAPVGGSRSSGIELLLRLRDESGRLVPPATFIPAAERYGLMPLLDSFVVAKAFSILAEWIARPDIARPDFCAINLSGTTFGDPGFIERVCKEFERHRIPPSMICFEITETSAIRDIDGAVRFIRALQGLGCRFSLDDFGSGMSSFAYLKHLSVDYLKIDGSFVRDMLTDPIDRAIVETITHVAKATGKTTIAEFVEDRAILRELGAIGVDYAQGYAIGMPQPFEAPREIARLRQRA